MFKVGQTVYHKINTTAAGKIESIFEGRAYVWWSTDRWGNWYSLSDIRAATEEEMAPMVEVSLTYNEQVKIALEKLRKIEEARSDPNLQQALLVLSPYTNVDDDPDEGRREAARLIRAALGL